MLVSMYSFGFMAISYTRRSENATSDLPNPAGLFGANAPLHLAARSDAQVERVFGPSFHTALVPAVSYAIFCINGIHNLPHLFSADYPL